MARGFHLKEYTVSELDKLFLDVGFRQTEAYVGISHRYFRVPVIFLKVLESALERLPYRLRHWLGNLRGFQNFLFVSVAALK